MRIFFALLVLLQTLGLSAQTLYPLKIRIDSVRFRVVATDTGLSLEMLEQQLGQRDFIVVSGVRLDDADLAVQYQSDQSKKGFATRVDLSLRPRDGELLTPQAYEIGTLAPTAVGPRTGWLDVNERLLEPESEYTLYIRKSLLGPVNCTAERPMFTVARQLPHYGAAVLGLGLLGWGSAKHAQSSERYNAYKRDWEEGLPEPAKVYDNAIDRRKAGNGLTAAGWAVIGADVAWYAWRWLRIRHKQQIYDQFCAPEKGLSRLEFGPTGAGARLCFRF